MELKPFKRLAGGFIIAATALALVGCKGDTGPAGATGAQGQQGAQGNQGVQGNTGPAGTPGAPGSNSTSVINVANMTSDQWAATTLTATVKSVDLSKGQPVVTFTVQNQVGMPIVGLSNATTTTTLPAATTPTATQNPANPAVVTTYPNFAFSIAKLVPGLNPATMTTDSSPTATWISYLIDSAPKATQPQIIPGHPTTDNTGTMTEDGYGTYTYTFARNIQQEATWLASEVAAGYFTGTAASGNYAPDLGDVSYQPTLTHRLGILVYGSFPGTGSNNATGVSTNMPPAVSPAKDACVTYDFVPGTAGTAPNTTAITTGRQIVDVSACNACHTVLGGGGAPSTDLLAGNTNSLSFHGGSYSNNNFCIFCHNEQLKYGATDSLPNPTTALATMVLTSGSTKVNGLSVGTITEWVHKFHMGVNLKYSNNVQPLMNSGWYPQDIRRCDTCHKQVSDSKGNVLNPQWANYQAVPSREACGSCHDAVNFATGYIAPGTQTTYPTTHLGGPQADDTLCAGCHKAGDIQIYHTPLQSPAQNGSNGTNSHSAAPNTYSWQSAAASNQPGGSWSVAYNVSTPGGLTVNSAGNPVLTFQILFTSPTGTTSPATINTYAAGTPMIANVPVVGGPTVGIQGAMTQEGLAATDFNIAKETDWTLQSIWNGTALLGATPVASKGVQAASAGWYSITFDGIVMPANTTLLGMGIGWSPFIETDLGLPASSDLASLNNEGAVNFTYNPANGQGGLQLPAQNVWADYAGSFKVGAVTTKVAARRVIIKENACSDCHADLGIFTPNSTATNSYASNFHNGYMNDPQHCVFCHTTAGTTGGWSYNAKTWVHGIHSAGFRTNAYTAQPNFPFITYPGILNDCEACHVPGSYDFSNSTNANQIAGMLWDTVALGYYPATKTTTPVSGSPTTVTDYMNLTGTYAIPAAGSYVSPWITPAGDVNTTTTATTVSTAYTAATLYGANPIAGTPTTKNGVTTTPAPSFYAGQYVLGAGTWTLQTPDPGRLVSSPMVASCSGCHDSQTAIAHMTTTGGGVHYGVASNSYVNGKLTSNETCIICHGPGTVGDIQNAHMSFSGASKAN